jgi:hypothetical protein
MTNVIDTLNRALTAAFDVVLTPLEALGRPLALVLASGVFGVLALLVFKRISHQQGIKAAKNKIKGHLIEIRLYQDDLAVVARAIGKVLARNLQYLAYNFGPFVPLAIPFVFVLAQLVVRYAFAPVPVEPVSAQVMPGRGTMLLVTLDAEHAGLAAGLRIELPDGVRALSPLVRNAARGRACQEVVASRAGTHEIGFVLANGERQTKRLVAGTLARTLQPERSDGLLDALLWPAEERFPAESAFAKIAFRYPDSDLGWLPGGVGGVLIVFLVASMAFGFVMLKPLGIEI